MLPLELLRPSILVQMGNIISVKAPDSDKFPHGRIRQTCEEPCGPRRGLGWS